MMRQYRSIKRQHPDAILFFRLGDFYEMFEADAKEASSILGLTLTSRHGVPMCGIPYHAARSYIGRLLEAGKKIAVCEQTALPEGGKGLAEREVVRIITPGTVVDEDYLDKSANNYLTAVGAGAKAVSVASVDLSTGELIATFFPREECVSGIRREIQRLGPREIIVQESLLEEIPEINRFLRGGAQIMINLFPDWDFDVETSREKLASQLGVANLKGFAVTAETEEAILSVCVLLDYVSDTQKGLLPHITDITVYGENDYLGLDETTQRNLEIIRNLADGGRKYTLLQVLDHTRTAMGARLLKKWLLNPSTDLEAIARRSEATEACYRNQLFLSSLRGELSDVLDLEWLAARVALDRAHAKDLLAVRTAIGASLRAIELSTEWLSLPGVTDELLDACGGLADLLDRAIHPDPSIVLTEGRLIADGYHEDVDRLRAMRSNSRAVLEEYLDTEKSEPGIQRLKVKYNRIIGYYIEVTKSHLSHVPAHFIRRQSLVGSERYTTDRLIELEAELNSATDRVVELERVVFLEVRERVKRHTRSLKQLASAVAELDCLQSYAYAATIHGFSRPTLTSSGVIEIRGGRHPVVEANQPSGEFVPNDTLIGADGVSFALITGPNMAGKSTYLRQVALIVLMAQAGSFVPAEKAVVGLVDKIFCRVGAQDNLARGESTFLVEMNETAHILRAMTPRSLIIMDEVGRGTGTNDGLSIAWAVSEHLIASGVKTLFATHFHELTSIENPAKINLALEVVEKNGEVVFLKRIKPGAADHSYGIHVARLAGIPAGVVARARTILEKLLAKSSPVDPETTPPASDGPRRTQSSLFEESELVESEIRSLDVDRTTPLEALKNIERWQRLLRDGR